MATISKTVMCLRVMGDELIPSDITKKLGHEPSRQMIKGEEYSYPKSRKPRIAKSGMWRLEAKERVPGDLDEQVSELFNHLTQDLDVWRLISTNYTIDLFCGLFMERPNEGISLSSSSLQEIGQRGIEIDFDIYGADED